MIGALAAFILGLFIFVALEMERQERMDQSIQQRQVQAFGDPEELALVEHVEIEHEREVVALSPSELERQHRQMHIDHDHWRHKH